MKKSGALRAIFDPPIRYGSKGVTAQIGALPPPPVLTGLTIVGSVTDTKLNNAYSCKVLGDYVFVANNNDNSVTAVDVTTKTAPTIAGTIKDNTVLNGAIDLAIQGTQARVAVQFGDRLAIVDISNPASLSLLGNVTDTRLDGALGIDTISFMSYVAAGNTNRLVTVNCSNPASPTISGSVQDNTNLNVPYGVAADGDTMVCYVTSNAGHRLTAVDVSTASAPAVLSSINSASQLNTPTRVRKYGNYCYVATSDGLAIVDVSDPFSMSIVGYYDANTLVAEACIWNGYPIFTLHSADNVAAVDTDTVTPTFIDDTGADTALDGCWGIDTDEATQYCYATGRFADSLVVIEIS